MSTSGLRQERTGSVRCTRDRRVKNAAAEIPPWKRPLLISQSSSVLYWKRCWKNSPISLGALWCLCSPARAPLKRCLGPLPAAIVLMHLAVTPPCSFWHTVYPHLLPPGPDNINVWFGDLTKCQVRRTVVVLCMSPEHDKRTVIRALRLNYSKHLSSRLAFNPDLLFCFIFFFYISFSVL